MSKSMLLVLLAYAVPARAAFEVEAAATIANPIRKVVTMLQDMQLKVTAEGKKEEALYEKFMCYCKNSAGSLDGSIAEAKNKIESLTSSLQASTEKKAQTEADLKEHTAGREEAKEAMAKATALRKKEETAYAKYKSDMETNIDATAAATSAISKGMGSGFLQTKSANLVRRYAMERAEMDDETRQELLAFLSASHSESYAPASTEIVGILKQMQDTMEKDLGDATATEKGAIQSYDSLMAAKKKEVAALQKQIETEMKRVGELGMAIAEQTNDLEETRDALAGDQQFLLEMEKSCKTKTAEWEEIKKTRAEELLALAETIKVLNDDDALELFKKTLPGASASLVQVEVDTKKMKGRALAAIKDAIRGTQFSHLPPRPELDLIALALNGQQKGFEKVIKMIDDLVANLKQEQIDDEAKKVYCEKQLDENEDKKKELENSISDSEKAIEEMTGTIASLKDEIKNLETGVKALDKSVAEATEQRKAEAADYEQLVTNDSQAKEVLMFAKNRLNKFYNPKLYKAPPKKELSAEDQIVSNFGAAASLVQISSHNHGVAAPPPPPETFGPYTKKSEESGGVIAMIDLLVKDLDKEMQEAKVDEENSQEEYEDMMAQSAKKRAQDSKALVEKNSAKAANEESLQAEKDSKAGLTKDLMATAEYIASLHAECDWLMKFFDVRKEARSGEIDALTKAKAVLSGADYSFVQTKAFLGKL